MKLNAGLARSLLMAASIGMVVPICAQTAPEPTPTKKPGGTPIPTRAPTRRPTVAPTKRPEPTPEPVADAEVKISGLVLPRTGGGFLGLELDGSKFKLSFYDEKKNPVATNAERALIRWNPVNKTGDMQAVLNKSEDGLTMRSSTFVPPPHSFKIYLTLINAEGETAEHYVANFRL